MRIILDTDKKTITVPYNYQDKLKAYNAMVMEISGDESKLKTFTSLIDEAWQYCITHSDQCLKTGKNPAFKKSAGSKKSVGEEADTKSVGEK